MMTWIALALLSLVFFILLSLGISACSLAPWLPSRHKDLQRVVDIADLGSEDVFCEVGCGNGRVSFHIHDNTDARVIGIERAWPLALVCSIRNWLNKRERFEMRHENFFSSDISEADVVYIFGMPRTMTQKLTKKLKDDCKPGARVISYAFDIDPWKPMRIDRPSDADFPIYEYQL